MKVVQVLTTSHVELLGDRLVVIKGGTVHASEIDDIGATEAFEAGVHHHTPIIVGRAPSQLDRLIWIYGDSVVTTPIKLAVEYPDDWYETCCELIIREANQSSGDIRRAAEAALSVPDEPEVGVARRERIPDDARRGPLAASMDQRSVEPQQVSVSQRNALRRANDYLRTSAFSFTRLVEQLEFEGFSNSDAIFGASSVEVDWANAAAVRAREYLKHQGFSRSGLLAQLLYEGFTEEQAEHGVRLTGL